MEYSKEFFELQFQFAGKAAHLTHLPLGETIFHFTAFGVLFELGYDFDPDHPVWRAYVEGLERSSNPVNWTYRYYLDRRQAVKASDDHRHWGCFSYNDHKGDRRIVRLHFINRDDSGFGPLSTRRKAARLDELASMFTDVKQTMPEAQMVRGESWLYNREQYTRLFPPSYGQSAHPVNADFRYRALWGQFVRWNGELHAALSAAFLQNLARQDDVTKLAGCFPYQILRVEGDIEAFYSFYGI